MDMQFEYDSDTDGMRLIKYLGTDNRVIIPGEYKGKKVTSIGPYAFIEVKDARVDGQNVKVTEKANDSIREIILPDSIMEICYCAFMECHELKTIHLPDSIQYIGPSAFYNCIKLGTITLPQMLRMILRGCFRNCISLQKVTMFHVNEIEFSAFEGCEKLEQVEFGEECYWLGKRAFENCKISEDMRIPDTVVMNG